MVTNTTAAPHAPVHRPASNPPADPDRDTFMRCRHDHPVQLSVCVLCVVELARRTGLDHTGGGDQS